MSSLLLLVRLALATAVVLAPGWAVARALGLRGAAVTVAWSLALIFGALAVTFAVGGGIGTTLVLLLAAGLVAAPFALRALPERRPPWWWRVVAAGVALGLLLWHVAGEVGGDGLFHLARVRKLLAFGDLSLESVGEFADGGLHPGYAFPLWHGFLALVAKVAMVDPRDVVVHEPSVLAPVAVLVAYEAGLALFRAAGPAAAAAAAQVALIALAPGHGGSYTALALPATASRQILVPAALALAIGYVASPSRGVLASAAAAGLALAVVHPTYALFLWLPFGGFLVVRWLWTREEAGRIGLALAALVVPAGLFLLWLLPVVRDTASHSPGAGELARGLRQYRGQLDVRSDDLYSLAPELFGRSGSIAVAALVLVPLAAFAARRRWAAYVLGGSLAVLLLCLTPWLFAPFSDAVSLSQSRRAAGFLPFAFAFAGGLVVAAALLRRWLLWTLALAAGIGLEIAYPGDFDYHLTDGGPALATWIAAVGGAVALVAGLAWRRRVAVEGQVGVAAALFLLPVVLQAAWSWSPSDARRPSPLTPGLVDALRHDVPERAIVFGDLETSY
ncbi:MAG TPA: hypothetical protein VFG79_04760, partial [Solirubrobacter sp.]|nr:hypothetical protein [Solirubrobacter sp.]